MCALQRTENVPNSNRESEQVISNKTDRNRRTVRRTRQVRDSVATNGYTSTANRLDRTGCVGLSLRLLIVSGDTLAFGVKLPHIFLTPKLLMSNVTGDSRLRHDRAPPVSK